MVDNPSFTLKEQLGYASGNFGNAMGQDMVGTFTTLFLTRYVGIEAAMITVLMVVTKIVNIVLDPILGAVLDNGFGRSHKSATRPLLLLSPFPLTVASVLLFVVPAQNMIFRIIWVFAFYLIFNIADATFDMSMLTMSIRMTSNPDDRKNFYTFSHLGATLGTTLPGGLIPIFVAMSKGHFGKEKAVYLIGALIFGIIGLVTMLMPYFTLKEKNPAVVEEKGHKEALNFKALFLNKPLMLLLVSQIIECIRQVCYGALAFFYLETLNAFWLSSVVGTFSVILSYIGILLVPFLGTKLSSRSMLSYSYLYSGTCYLLLLLTGYKSLFLVGFFIALSGFPNGLMGVVRKILVADSTEYMEWKTWKKYGTPIRSDGMVFALNSMVNRINGLWKDLLLPFGLTLIGYVSATVIGGETIKAVQSPETLRGIFYLVAIPGTVGNLVPGIIMLFDDYTGKKKEKILQELKEMHAERDKAQQC